MRLRFHPLHPLALALVKIARRFLPPSVCAVLLLAALLVAPVHLHATTVMPPEFDALVAQADYVVRGTVKAINSQWRSAQGHRSIVTFVEIEVTETIVGTAPRPLILEMLGGRVGADEMTVQGSPRFAVGEDHILFIRGNGRQFNPLVALMHGQYPLIKDTAGRAQVMRSDGSALRDEKEVSLPLHAAPATNAPALAPGIAPTPTAAATAPALTPAEFAQRIRLSRQKATAQP